jgi:hypothetical protein
VAHQTNLANTPVPPIGAEPVALQHSAGAVAANLPVWERMPNGQSAAGGGAAVFEIPVNALLAGSHARGRVALAVPANADQFGTTCYSILRGLVCALATRKLQHDKNLRRHTDGSTGDDRTPI